MLIPIVEWAGRHGISAGTVWKMVQLGRVRCCHFGRSLAIDENEPDPRIRKLRPDGKYDKINRPG